MHGLLCSHSAQASHYCGFFVAEHRLSGARASVVVARELSSCGSLTLEHRLNSCGKWAYLLHNMWDLPRPGVKLMSPALAGEFFTTESPGKPPFKNLIFC